MSVCVFQRAFPPNIFCPDTVNEIPLLSKPLYKRTVLYIVGSLEATPVSNLWIPGATPLLPPATTGRVSKHCRMPSGGSRGEREVTVKQFPVENGGSSILSHLIKMKPHIFMPLSDRTSPWESYLNGINAQH